MVRLPPSAALRAFEAAARHLSYTRAAEELHITQSAVSHQIRHIEELWGLKLFERRGRRFFLTENGQALVPVIREFIDRLGLTLKELQADEGRGSLRVSLLQSFAFKWLVPRLGSFNRQYPEIDVWISTTDALVDFASTDVDVAIRLGSGQWPGLHSTLLLREYVFPVCSPEFLYRFDAPTSPPDLFRFPLLHRFGDDNLHQWEDWFRDAGVWVKSLPKGSRFPDTSMAVQAAIDGQGIALARSAHVADDLAAGRLIKLLDVHCPSSLAYYAVCPRGTETRSRVAAFIEWLLDEAVAAQKEFDQVAGVVRQGT